ncbi:MAG: hypothetical protein MJ179_00980 [Treponema sp.]|nr:hypothetical protein [Treponema sp.]
MNPMDAIDQPIITALKYFGDVMSYFLKMGTRLGLIVGLIGLIWSGFKVTLGRMQIKELWWDTLSKWIIYILLMASWGPLTTGIASLANNISSDVGVSSLNMNKNIVSLKDKINKLRFDENQNLANKMKEIANGVVEVNLPDYVGGDLKDYNDYLVNLVSQSNNRQKTKDNKIKDLRAKLAEIDDLSSTKTLAALNELLGDKGDINSYIKTSMKLEGDTQYGFLSGASIFRFGTFICSILWLQNELEYNQELADIDNRDYEGMFQDFTRMGDKVDAFGRYIVNCLMCMIVCFFLILSCAFTVIQYEMTCLEFIIIAGIGIFFVPFILFDGSKELPKKFVPVFISLFTKLLVITLCMFYVMWTYLNLANGIVSGANGMNWFNMGCIILQILIGLVLTQNAPKIAQTITTGQAQLSMGELVAAGGTAAGIGHFAAKGANTIKQKAQQGAEGFARHSAASTAGRVARDSVLASGGSMKEARQAAHFSRHATLHPNGYVAQSDRAVEASMKMHYTPDADHPSTMKQYNQMHDRALTSKAKEKEAQIAAKTTGSTNTSNSEHTDNSGETRSSSSLDNIKLDKVSDA